MPSSTVAKTEPPDELLQRAVAGDVEAQGAVAAMYYPRMRRWALLEAGSPERAEEAVQEALIRWLRLGHSFEIGTRFTPWMRTLVRHAARDTRDRRRALGWVSWLRPSPSADRQLDLSQAASRVWQALEGLTSRQREAVDLVDFQSCSQQDAAVRLDVKPSTLRVHLRDGRQRLAAALGPEDHALLKES